MKKFLIDTAHFSCYLLAANLLCFLSIKMLYYDDYSQFDPNYSTYLVADSHGHSLDTLTQAYGIFNFSDPSDSYQDMLRKVKYTVAHSEVKRILISADDHTLTTYREQNNNLDRSSIYATSEDYNSRYEQFSERYIRRYIPLLHGKSRDAFLMHIKRLWSVAASDKNLWADATREYRQQKAMERADIHFGEAQYSEKMEKYLLEIIEICKSNGIEIEGIKFPLSPEYARASKNRGFPVDALFEAQGIQVLDFQEFSDQPEFFRDQDHLSEKGAGIFSNLLSQDTLEQ